MTPADLSRTVLGAVRRAVEEGALQAPVPERITVERPRPGGRGDYATNVALRLAGPAGRRPRDVAEAIRARITGSPGIARVEITGPGFLNFTLGADPAAGLVRAIGEEGRQYGHGGALRGVRVRFAPAGELRARVITDTVVRLLEAQGATAAVEPDGGERITALPAPDEAVFERAGRDAALWALLRPAAHDQPLPVGALLVQKEPNALFRVRYAHSRSRALLRAADRLGIAASYQGAAGALCGADGGSLAALLAALADHPAVLESAARLRAPDRLARHLEATADALLGFQHTALPVGDEKPSAAHRSRLALAEAAGTVLAGGLALLGISAPEHL
ncbi:ArgS-related anticodon-binding protein NrtL [Streptomyces pacificus]|uniref:ArgS-related anticodon-binding protein NrtL n=1 Tax=Streptomyces pacificus TaxID=2705029 RepID=UPI0015662ACE|nr:DALR anticodon-binding domain-containing protein [Streptomyces pacificus]